MGTGDAVVYVVDDDEAIRDSMQMLITSIGLDCECFANGRAFLASFQPDRHACLVVDIRMPGMSGLDLQAELNQRNVNIPLIFITGHGDVPMAVKAMKAGALDFIQKPFRDQELLDRINLALAQDEHSREADARRKDICRRRDALTPREREVMDEIVKGHTNKTVAVDLGVSQRTVEIHRARVMQKMQARSLAELVRLATELSP